MVIARFLDRVCLALWASGLWVPYAAKFDPLLSLDCAPTPSTLAQSKERKGSNFAIWQHYPVRVEVHSLSLRVPGVGVVAEDGVAEGVSTVHA